MKAVNSPIFQSALNMIPEDVVIQVNLLFENADKIAEILKRQNSRNVNLQRK